MLAVPSPSPPPLRSNARIQPRLTTKKTHHIIQLVTISAELKQLELPIMYCSGPRTNMKVDRVQGSPMPINGDPRDISVFVRLISFHYNDPHSCTSKSTIFSQVSYGFDGPKLFKLI